MTETNTETTIDVEQTVERTISDLHRERGDMDIDADSALPYVKHDALGAAEFIDANFDDLTLAEIATHVDWATVDDELDTSFTPQDIAYAAWAKRVASRDVMSRYTDLDDHQFVTLHDALDDLQTDDQEDA